MRFKQAQLMKFVDDLASVSKVLVGSNGIYYYGWSRTWDQRIGIINKNIAGLVKDKTLSQSGSSSSASVMDKKTMEKLEEISRELDQIMDELMALMSGESPPAEVHSLLMRYIKADRVGHDESAKKVIELKRKNEEIQRSSTPIWELTKELTWDSSLLIFLRNLTKLSKQKNIKLDLGKLPQGLKTLLELASSSSNADIRSKLKPHGFLTILGIEVLAAHRSCVEMLRFLGEVTIAFGKFLRGKARFRGSDLALLIQDCGAQSLPIITLISLLVGLILAYVGSLQLVQFGAEAYIADLVGIGMAREMGAMMTAIIMAGRIGAAFAAQLGSMRINDEIDALKTLGISPMEFLVLPRIIALVLMIPLLCLYSDFMGILGGLIVATTRLDVSVLSYYTHLQNALSISTFMVGISKCTVFGLLIGMAGCLRGMTAERSSAAIGNAATSAVVTSIVFVVVTDALFTIIFNALGI